MREDRPMRNKRNDVRARAHDAQKSHWIRLLGSKHRVFARIELTIEGS
jgi:hypothetical protein